MLCPSCGLRFDAENLIRADGGTAQITLTDISVDCPRCGASAKQVVQGNFAVSEDGTWRHLAAALVSSEATTRDYEELVSVLRSAQALGLPKEEVARTVRSRVPHLAAIADFLGSQRGDRVALWLTVIIAVMAYFTSPATEPPTPSPPPSVTVVVQQPSEEQVQEWIKAAVEEASRAAEKKLPKRR